MNRSKKKPQNDDLNNEVENNGEIKDSTVISGNENNVFNFSFNLSNGGIFAFIAIIVLLVVYLIAKFFSSPTNNPTPHFTSIATFATPLQLLW
jgi:hypothetical protein